MKFIYRVFVILVAAAHMPVKAQQASNAKINDASSVSDLNIVDFKVALNDNMVNINWETINEYNCSEFVVEKAGEDGNFFLLGVVKAQGNPYSTFDYTFTDAHPVDGINYYRLKICSGAGTKYSGIAFVNYVDVKVEPVIFPNPSSNNFFEIRTNTSELTLLKIYNRTGKLVHESQCSPCTGNIMVNCCDLPRGVYYCSIQSGYATFEKVLILGD